jgi:dihydroorotate dehydrogenase
MAKRIDVSGLTAYYSAHKAIEDISMTVEPRKGNPEPRYWSFQGGSINSMGLPNLGYLAYARLIPELKRFGKPVIASVRTVTSFINSPATGVTYAISSSSRHNASSQGE